MKTKNTDLIIVADLGLLRAYRVVQGEGDRQPHLKLVDELRPTAAHQKLSDQLTDKPGRFSRGRGPGHVAGDLSGGERHDLESEQHRRLIHLLAERINTWLADDQVARCSLAASAPIHLQLLESLPAPARAKVTTTLARDLTKTDPDRLLSHFQP